MEKTGQVESFSLFVPVVNNLPPVLGQVFLCVDSRAGKRSASRPTTLNIPTAVFMTNPNEDYYAWTQETIEKLRQGRLNEVNMEVLIEELEDMGRSERRGIESRLSVLLMHLLKWQYQPDRRGHRWRATVKEQRLRVKRLLRDNPSLQSQFATINTEAYESAVLKAVADTHKAETTFPSTFEQTGWTLEQVLDMDFYPNNV
ncbi:protein of unknown function DUF29 [Nitrosococcus watsonii C-113]|uniref:DUF29 domain-containing protein n=2 Tax=Nitrosococcus TaxID=1227 RepID=D8K927_NITWC|nr:protein of unknown function DUF29 [Nitrosococcus watsonii C-113]